MPFSGNRNSALWLSVLMAIVWISPASGAGSARKTPTFSSEITRLTVPPCQTLEASPEGANGTRLCPGLIGFQLLLLDSDSRMSVTILTPDGKQHALDFWNTVTPKFSSLGENAEWRLRNQAGRSEMVGVIFRLKIQEDPETARQVIYLVVAKIDHSRICVVGKLPDQSKTLREARRLADSPDAVCVPSF